MNRKTARVLFLVSATLASSLVGAAAGELLSILRDLSQSTSGTTKRLLDEIVNSPGEIPG